MAFMFGPTQIGMDPESSSAVVQQSAAEMIRRGTTVAKGNRVYMYVLEDSGATAVTAGGLLYLLTLATWDPLNGKASVTNGANGLTSAGNFSLAAGMEITTAKTPGNFGFIQQRGRAMTKIQFPTGSNVGTLGVANLTNAATPAQAIAATTTNIIATNQVCYLLAAAASNLADCILILDLC